MFQTPSDLHPRTIWPLNVDRSRMLLSSPPLIITSGHSKFVVWEERGLYYSVRSFRYHTRWWHFSRPDRTMALRQALEWVNTYDGKKDRVLVKEIMDETKERDRQLAAIDDLLKND